MHFFQTITAAFSRSDSADSIESMEEPFLPTDDLSTTTKENDDMTSWKHAKRPRSQLFRLLPWAITSVSVAALFWVSHSQKASYCDLTSGFNEMVYSPAQHLIESQNVVFTGGFAPRLTIYQGPSTPERDQAWEDLYHFGISRIPKSSAAKLVNKTVPIPGDDGYYVVELNVFHQLHCLNMLRLRLWSNQTFSPDDDRMSMAHMSHCLDALRQSIMCSVDITPIPWTWNSEAKEAKPVAEIEHTCRNFEKVRLWAKENHVGSFDTKVYVEDDLSP